MQNALTITSMMTYISILKRLITSAFYDWHHRSIIVLKGMIMKQENDSKAAEMKLSEHITRGQGLSRLESDIYIMASKS